MNWHCILVACLMTAACFAQHEQEPPRSNEPVIATRPSEQDKARAAVTAPALNVSEQEVAKAAAAFLDWAGASTAGQREEIRRMLEEAREYKAVGAAFCDEANRTAESDFTWQNGVLKHLAIGQPVRTAGLRFTQFAGHLSLNNGNLRFAQSRILTSSGIYEISGTATLERALALTLRERRKTAQRYSVTGTLDAPHVAAETNTASTAGAGIAR